MEMRILLLQPGQNAAVWRVGCVGVEPQIDADSAAWIAGGEGPEAGHSLDVVVRIIALGHVGSQRGFVAPMVCRLPA